MPVSVVIGGQYGSEGKGKVALHVAKARQATTVIRVGGPNSGHTGIDSRGREWIFRQLPASCLAGGVRIVLPAGSLIDADLLASEIQALGLAPERLIIDAQASIVTKRHQLDESSSDIVAAIGSTGSGTGASLGERISRKLGHLLASQHPLLRHYTHDFVPGLLRQWLRKGERLVIEGTQGFGLSLWHGGLYPFATSRDTTAAGFLSECGLSPTDVDDIILVIRAFPIRVGGNSGPLPNEIDWPTLASEVGLPKNHMELTSATKRMRRVARFHPDVVRRAITVNNPHRIAMNHLDYVGNISSADGADRQVIEFVKRVEKSLARRIDLLGFSPSTLISTDDCLSLKGRVDADVLV
jgi:adenylosuccinate synthase